MNKLYSVVKECEKPVNGVIKGDIPDWVHGSLYRNGPGLYDVGEYQYEHIFDPLAMVQRFHIENKRISYQCRFLESENYKQNMQAQRIVVRGFGTVSVPDPCQNIFQRFLSYFQPEERNDNTNVNIFPLKDELYTATETNFIHRIDPETLETLERIDLSSIVAVHSATAHPHFDRDGTIHNIGYSYNGGPKIHIIKIPPKQRASDEFPKGEIISSIKSSGRMSVSYLHSFGITGNYYVYVEQPMFINLFKILTSRIRGATIASCIDWWPTVKARFRIIDKRTGEEINPDFKYEADPFMIFHHINAYEDDGHIVLDLCSFSSQDPLNFVYLQTLTSAQCEAKWRQIEEPRPCRYVIPLILNNKTERNVNLVSLPYATATSVRTGDDTVHCSMELLADTGVEFPQINYASYNGKKYRYVYGVGWHSKGKHFHTIMKIDTHTRTFKEWAEDNCYPSEPVFVKNPNASSEDDGIILVAVNSSEFDVGKNAFVLVLNAKTMLEIARAEFNIPRFPRDFHGYFRPAM